MFVVSAALLLSLLGGGASQILDETCSDPDCAESMLLLQTSLASAEQPRAPGSVADVPHASPEEHRKKVPHPRPSDSRKGLPHARPKHGKEPHSLIGRDAPPPPPGDPPPDVVPPDFSTPAHPPSADPPPAMAPPDINPPAGPPPADAPTVVPLGTKTGPANTKPAVTPPKVADTKTAPANAAPVAPSEPAVSDTNVAPTDAAPAVWPPVPDVASPPVDLEGAAADPTVAPADAAPADAAPADAAPADAAPADAAPADAAPADAAPADAAPAVAAPADAAPADPAIAPVDPAAADAATPADAAPDAPDTPVAATDAAPDAPDTIVVATDAPSDAADTTVAATDASSDAPDTTVAPASATDEGSSEAQAGTVTTALTQDVVAGATAIPVVDTTGLSAGMSLTISAGSTSETKAIVSVSPDAVSENASSPDASSENVSLISKARRVAAGTVTVDSPLQNNFTAGAIITATPTAKASAGGFHFPFHLPKKDANATKLNVSHPAELNTWTNTTGATKEVGDDQLAAVLLGSICFIMVLFYMVNSEQKPIAQNTWALLSESTSILIAMMIWQIINALVNRLPDVTLAVHTKEVTPWKSVGVAAGENFAWWILVLWTIFRKRGNLLLLKAYGTLGGHILGISAISTFGLMATTEPFRDAWYWMFAVLGIFIVSMVIIFFCQCTRSFIRGFASGDSRQAADNWFEQITETSTDFLCIGAGFLFCFYARFIIMGECPPVYDTIVAHTVQQTLALAIVGSVFVVFAMMLTRLMHVDLQARWSHRLGLIRTSLAMAGSFCWLWAANWALWNKIGNNLTEHLLVAVAFTAIGILKIWVVATVQHHGGADKRLMRGLLTAYALSVGLSWEQTFDTAMDYNSMDKLWMGALALIILIPAWFMFILPPSDDELRTYSKSEVSIMLGVPDVVIFAEKERRIPVTQERVTSYPTTSFPGPTSSYPTI